MIQFGTVSFRIIQPFKKNDADGTVLSPSVHVIDTQSVGKLIFPNK